MEDEKLIDDCRTVADALDDLGPRIQQESGQSEGKDICTDAAKSLRDIADGAEQVQKSKGITTGL